MTFRGDLRGGVEAVCAKTLTSASEPVLPQWVIPTLKTVVFGNFPKRFGKLSS